MSRANSVQHPKKRGSHCCEPLENGGRGRKRTADTGIFNDCVGWYALEDFLQGSGLSCRMTLSDQNTEQFGGPEGYAYAKRELFRLVEMLLSYPPDRENERHFLLAAIRRTLSLETTFVHAVEERNGQMAMTLIRLNLDTLARAYALYWAEQTVGMTAESFARDVAGGKSIRKMKLRGVRENATDAWLIAQMAPLADWIQKVYETTSGAIHFSDFHIRQLLQQHQSKEMQEDGSLKVELVLGAADYSPGSQRYVEVRQAFLHITLMLLSLVEHRCKLAGIFTTPEAQG